MTPESYDAWYRAICADETLSERERLQAVDAQVRWRFYVESKPAPVALRNRDGHHDAYFPSPPAWLPWSHYVCMRVDPRELGIDRDGEHMISALCPRADGTWLVRLKKL